jgi:HEPN domain-containing protein
MKQITQEWINSEQDDLKIIDKIINDPMLTHQVAFHAQQAIEKLLKAVMEEYDKNLMKVHSLEKLLKTAQKFIEISLDHDTIMKLDQLYIDARYPGNMGLLPHGKPNIEEATKFKKMANKIFDQINSELKD